MQSLGILRKSFPSAKNLGLPLNKNVEVWLCGKVRLQGRLELLSQTLPKDSAAANF